MSHKSEDEHSAHSEHEPAKEPHHSQNSANHDYEPKHTEEVLREKIRFLEEELVRKDELIEKLKKDNALLFKTALKSSASKVDRLKPEDTSQD